MENEFSLGEVTRDRKGKKERFLSALLNYTLLYRLKFKNNILIYPRNLLYVAEGEQNIYVHSTTSDTNIHTKFLQWDKKRKIENLSKLFPFFPFSCVSGWKEGSAFFCNPPHKWSFFLYAMKATSQFSWKWQIKNSFVSIHKSSEMLLRCFHSPKHTKSSKRCCWMGRIFYFFYFPREWWFMFLFGFLAQFLKICVGFCLPVNNPVNF